ncbi:hypothetical protein [Actinomyces gaoshouyii]|uniref:Uncharacterized protein n=1 Tax=Actinomyces gaoshouyii TaxID=1960083 RepID=A0A8H9H9P6_9ACTO|nr:hypothetical protein [Actinomyces gaoshouyii]ARD41187.1 hypothetical protein B6G06_01335 [Actinomyces gaoshouyii]GGO99613.1 hypothetical protein GCM10011612_17300 [Actinomyces gaoshouyii]
MGVGHPVPDTHGVSVHDRRLSPSCHLLAALITGLIAGLITWAVLDGARAQARSTAVLDGGDDAASRPRAEAAG